MLLPALGPSFRPGPPRTKPHLGSLPCPASLLPAFHDRALPSPLLFAAAPLLPFLWKLKGDTSSEKPPQPWQAEELSLGTPSQGFCFLPSQMHSVFTAQEPAPQDRAHVGTTNSILWFKPQTQESSRFLSLISSPTSNPSSNSISSTFEVHPAPTTSPRLHCPCGRSLCSLRITRQHKGSC